MSNSFDHADLKLVFFVLLRFTKIGSYAVIEIIVRLRSHFHNKVFFNYKILIALANRLGRGLCTNEIL